MTETYESPMFIDLYETRNREGYMIGCGKTAAQSEADAKLSTFDAATGTYTSPNMSTIYRTAALK